MYRTRAIITRGLYICYPIFEVHFFAFKEVFSENSGLVYGQYSRAVCNQERVMMARVRYINYEKTKFSSTYIKIQLHKLNCSPDAMANYFCCCFLKFLTSDEQHFKVSTKLFLTMSISISVNNLPIEHMMQIIYQSKTTKKAQVTNSLHHVETRLPYNF